MARTRFKTKLSKAQKRKNLLFFLVIFAGCYAFCAWFCSAIGVIDDWVFPETYLLTLAIMIFVLILLQGPVIIVAFALGAQRGMAKRVRDDVSFVPKQGIDYYRDSFGELSPALVSLLIDLNIYGSKDIAATLLRMQNKNAISFQANGRIVITGTSRTELDYGERELLDAIENGRIRNKRTLNAWKRNRFIEAEWAGYIRRAEVPLKKRFRYVYLALAFTVLAIIFWSVFLHSDLMAANTVLSMFLLLVIGTIEFVPWYLAAREVFYQKRGDTVWERTDIGNEMAEKIAGLSRFIHEFSLLSEAEKEQVALWDDYLVYAVVLEENEKIVKDVCRQHRIKLRKSGSLYFRAGDGQGMLEDMLWNSMGGAAGLWHLTGQGRRERRGR
jgi:hypothetical protein